MNRRVRQRNGSAARAGGGLLRRLSGPGDGGWAHLERAPNYVVEMPVVVELPAEGEIPTAEARLLVL